jgi:hypothetical protein
VGLAARLPLPQGPLVSFGLAGALVAGLPAGALVSARRIVDEEGRTLWEGRPLDVSGAREVVLCGAARVVDDTVERARLATRTGADAVDMESARLAASGALVGAVRAVSDSAGRPVGRLARAAKPDGAVDWGAVARAFATEPRTAARAALDARRALAALEGAARTLARA